LSAGASGGNQGGGGDVLGINWPSLLQIRAGIYNQRRSKYYLKISTVNLLVILICMKLRIALNSAELILVNALMSGEVRAASKGTVTIRECAVIERRA
jgi:hypothetical protein